MEDLGSFIFENWGSFLDDCETLLEENRINPNDLLRTLNSINPPIQFTVDYRKDAIPFLDVLIKRNNSPVIRQKRESQSGCFKKEKHAKISEKQTFLTP